MSGKFHKRSIETGALAQGIDGLEASGRNEPGSRIAGDAITAPLLDGCQKSFVQRLLGEFEVAEETDQSGEDAARVDAVDIVHKRAKAFSADRILGHKTL